MSILQGTVESVSNKIVTCPNCLEHTRRYSIIGNKLVADFILKEELLEVSLDRSTIFKATKVHNKRVSNSLANWVTDSLVGKNLQRLDKDGNVVGTHIIESNTGTEVLLVGGQDVERFDRLHLFDPNNLPSYGIADSVSTKLGARVKNKLHNKAVPIFICPKCKKPYSVPKE